MENNSSVFDKIKESYSSSWKYFIKPQQYKYDEEELPLIMNYDDNNIFRRKSFQIINKFCNKIQCHFYYHTNLENINIDDFKNNNCLIYLHSQSGNSIQGKFLLNYCIENKISLCLIDFQGCGNSEGEFISLGWHEQDDLELLINYIRINMKVEKIFLYGRSMGAITSILYLERNCFNIEKCILDSPFYNLRNTSERMAKEIVKLPDFLISFLLDIIKNEIKGKIGFDIFSIKPKIQAKNITIPIFLIGSKNDNLVNLKEINNLFKHFPEKNNILKIIDEKHNEQRNSDLIEEIFNFLLDMNNISIPRKVSENIFYDNKSVNFNNYSKSPVFRKSDDNYKKVFLYSNTNNNIYSNNFNKKEDILSETNILKFKTQKKNKINTNRDSYRNPINYHYNEKNKFPKNFMEESNLNFLDYQKIKNKNYNILNYNYLNK